MKKAHAQEFMEYLNTWGNRHQVDREMETVVTENMDEEIVRDRVEKVLAFLDTWSVICPDGLIKT